MTGLDIPAEAGTQGFPRASNALGPRLRGDDCP
jgi:hypothetical protein